jgi:hypothetical protein
MLLAVPGLVFEPGPHRYTYKGAVMDSVTKIMKENGLSIDYSGVDRDVLANAGHRGTQVHHAVALFELGQDWQEVTEERFWPFVECYLRWRDKAKWRPAFIEQHLVDPDHEYVGTLDGWGRLYGHYALPDIKTRDIDKADGFQTAAYLAALIVTYELVTGEPAPKEMYQTKRYGLRLFDNGSEAHLEPFTDPRDIDHFRTAAACSALRRRLGRPSPFLNEEEKQQWQETKRSFPTRSTRQMQHRTPRRRSA